MGEVLVEAVLPGARHFTCSVLATEQVRRAGRDMRGQGFTILPP